MRMISTTFSPVEWATAIATLVAAFTSAIVAIFAAKVGRGNKEKIEQVHEEVKTNGHE
jgi:hypothetical protein